MECKDCKIEYVKKEKSNGGYFLATQCLNCGKCTGSNLSFSLVGGKEFLNDLPIYDDNLNSEYYKKLSEYQQELRIKERKDNFTLWLELHNEYLLTDIWRSKRDRVLKRDQYICQACLISKATEVHHLSYLNWKNEPLFELTSICNRCHVKITKLSRERNNL